MLPRLKFLRSALVAALAAVALGAAVNVATVVQPHQAADAAAMSNYLQNKFIDWFLRAQTYTPPATVYVALDTTAGSASACGTEVSTTSTGYARVAVTSSLADWAGTQGAGTTTASSGTSGQTSNNVAITFGAPTASWSTIVGFCVYDAATGGNLLFFAPLTVSKTVNNGDAAPSFAVGALTYTISQLYDPAALFRLSAANDAQFDPVRQAAGY